jgi:poly(beta-D-mannuronate) lyase
MILSNKSCENIYRYNTFFNSEGTLTLRHGNRCTVHSNFFLGTGNDRAGGVRIIGEDHLVYNNYFQDLMGTGYRAALPIMNGVPNSPLNRYFQVKNARVLFNTFVNCFENIVLGAGESDELSLPPKDCLIANNAISTIFSNEIVTVEDEPENLQWQGNIFEGYNLGIAVPDGITMEDSLFLFAEDSLWRPAEGSPLIGSAEGDFSFITADMDGQPRFAVYDVGADQFSMEPVINRPLAPNDVGPRWYPPPQPPEPVIYVGAGIDSLFNALQLARDGDIIELITDGGIYANNHDLEITKKVTIRARDSLQKRPVLRQIESDNSARSIFVLGGNGRLTLQSIELDGMSDSETPAKYLIRSEDVPLTKEYRLIANDCYFHDVSLDGNGNFFRAYAGTQADSIIFTNCLFENAGKEGIRLKDEADGSGQYNVGYFEMTNCTMWNIPKEAVYIYAGDDNMFTTGPVIEIDHCTFDNCGYDTAVVIHPRECDFTTIKNSLITNSPASPSAVILYGQAAEISYSDVFNTGNIAIERGAQIGPGMLYVDPVYTDAVSGNFRLDETSPVIGKAEDGQTMGDLRWAEGLTGMNLNDGQNISYNFELYPGYPNPFNPSTTIHYNIHQPGFVSLAIYDINGRLVEEIDHGYKTSGHYTSRWNARDRASGIYFCTLSWEGQIRTRKLILMR